MENRFEEIKKIFNSIYDRIEGPKVDPNEILIDTLIVAAKLFNLAEEQESRIQSLEKYINGYYL